MFGMVFLPDPLYLQIKKEAFHHGVMTKPQVCPTIAFMAHAAHQAMLGQQRLMLGACVLRAPV